MCLHPVHNNLEGSAQLPIDEVRVVNSVQVWSVRGQLLEKALHVPQSVCDGAEVALHDAGHELVPVMLRHGHSLCATALK